MAADALPRRAAQSVLQRSPRKRARRLSLSSPAREPPTPASRPTPPFSIASSSNPTQHRLTSWLLYMSYGAQFEAGEHANLRGHKNSESAWTDYDYWQLQKCAVLTSGSWSDRLFFEKLFFAVDQRIDVVRGEFKTVPVRDRIRGACFDAVTAENAARIIDIVNAGVAFAGGDAAGIGIFRGFDVNAIRGAGRGTEKASNALLEAGFVAVQHVNPAIARLKMHWLERIILRDRFTKHIPEGHAEALHQRGERLADFPKDGCHRLGV